MKGTMPSCQPLSVPHTKLLLWTCLTLPPSSPTCSQWFSWIHREDLVGLIVEALKNDSFSGVVNGTAPTPVRMNEMCGALGEALGRPSWLPVPGFALQVSP